MATPRITRPPIVLSPGKYGFRGVRRYADANRRRPFYARARQGEAFHYSQAFETAEEAARAYDGLARRLHGAKAILNFGGAT